MSYYAGTPLDLERYLAKAISYWVQDFQLKSPIDRGAVAVPIEVVQGFVPSYYAGPEAAEQDKAPVISVRCTAGMYMRKEGKVTANIMVLTWDDDIARVGYRDPLNLANHIIFHLQESVRIGRSFVLSDDPIHFQEVVDPFKDFFPYWVCGLSAQFIVQAATPPMVDAWPTPSRLEGGTEGWYEPTATPAKPGNNAK